jgi:two-component system, NtrC family, sensor kinase
MKQASIPFNETRRLHALLEYAVLDTPPEPDYDDMTLMASSICEAPIALLSLIDQGRQWFKSRVGLDATETAREIAFCAHTIHGVQPLMIKDTLQDDRFSNNPLVTGAPQVRFYAGAPLINPEGLALGSLCVIDHAPRELSAEQLRMLESLARQVMRQLELRKTQLTLKTQSEELQKTARLLGETQDLLVHSLKLSFLGEIATEIAHEINNPLAIVIGKISVLKKDLLGQDLLNNKNKADLDMIEVAAERIKKIVRALKSFSRESSKDPLDAVSVKILFEEVATLLQRRFADEDIALTIEPVEESCFVACRQSEILQILINLLENAFDAVKTSPIKEISLSAHHSDANETVLRVRDSGPGIPPDLREKIMRPFFTTKGVGEGTGLGLSISKSLATSNEGSLILESETERTTFELRLKSTAIERKSS